MAKFIHANKIINYPDASESPCDMYINIEQVTTMQSDEMGCVVTIQGERNAVFVCDVQALYSGCEALSKCLAVSNEQRKANGIGAVEF